MTLVKSYAIATVTCATIILNALAFYDLGFMIAIPEIGLASAADAKFIALLSRHEIEHGLRWTWTEHRVRRAIADKATNVVVAKEGAEVVGFAIMSYEDDHAHLCLLAVVPHRRRRGIATALMAWLEETLMVAGARALQVEVRAINRAAIEFYTALGFEQINASRGYYQGVETALHMVKELFSDA